MPSFSLQIRTSKGTSIYRLDEGDIIEWMENGSSDLKRGRITALQSRDGAGHERSKPIRIEPVDINNSATGGRERWISRWAVMHVYDAAGNAKTPTEGREG